MKRLAYSVLTGLLLQSTLAYSGSDSQAALTKSEAVHMKDSFASGDKRRLLQYDLPGAENIPNAQFPWNRGLYNVDCHFVNDVATGCTASKFENGLSNIIFSDEQAKAVGYVFMSNINDDIGGVAGATEIRAGVVVCNMGGDEAAIKNIDVTFVKRVPQSFSPEFFALMFRIGYRPY
jgi:hypothetical protein